MVPFLLVFAPITYTSSFSPPFELHALPNSSSLLYHSNYTWRRVEVMKLLVMQISPPSRHVVTLRSKHSRQDPVLKHPQSIYCILASFYIRFTLNSCSFVHQCNTFTFYFLLIVDMFRPHPAIFRCYCILSRSWCSVMPIFVHVMLPAMC
jgi:hypothetical protein